MPKFSWTVALGISSSARRFTSGWSRCVAGRLSGFVGLDGVVDIDAEKARLDRAIGESTGVLARVEGKLSNPQFLERAPAAVVEKERAKQSELSELIAVLASQRQRL